MARRTALIVSILTILAASAAVALATPKDDWPKITGELWINSGDRDTSHTGTPKNDKLLGGPGDDDILF